MIDETSHRQASLIANQDLKKFNQTSTKLRPDFNTHRGSSRPVCERTNGLHIQQMAHNTQLITSSAAPATQHEAVPKAINCRRASADLKVVQVLHLRHKNDPEVLQVLRLPRKTSLDGDGLMVLC